MEKNLKKNIYTWLNQFAEHLKLTQLYVNQLHVNKIVF